MTKLSFRLNDRLYLRDPQVTPLGQRILRMGVELIDTLGFEQFTFKKLAAEVNTTEPSIYRYFENKHRFLHYLSAWYWSWIEYRLELATASLETAEQKLRASIRLITEEQENDDSFEYVNEEVLQRIVVNELGKTYLTKWVDADNQAGYFGGMKTLTKKLSGYIREFAPFYPFPDSLGSLILLTANEQLFFSQHLPALSSIDRRASSNEQHVRLRKFIESLVFGALQK